MPKGICTRLDDWLITGYGSKTILRAGDTIAPLAFPDAAVDMAELLKK